MRRALSLLVALALLPECGGAPGQASPDEATPPPTKREVGTGDAVEAAPDPLPALREAYPETVAIDPERRARAWFDLAYHLTDRELIEQRFADVKYRLPKGALVLVVHIRDGVDQPRFDHYTVGNTAFEPAPHSFIPLSTVKLMATVGALWTLAELGLTGDTRLRFHDVEGEFDGPLDDIYSQALLHSDNECYNRLVEVAGWDEINERTLTARWGLPIFVIRARYGSAHKGHSLKKSPKISYRTEEGWQTIDRRRGHVGFPHCPRGNCVTIFELHDAMRRIVLWDELPEAQRFPIPEVDQERIRGYLLEARNRLQPSARKAWGESVEVYNEVGRSPGIVLIENAYLRAPASGERMFVVLSLPFPRGDDPIFRLHRLTKTIIPAMKDAASPGPGLQEDAGPETSLELRRRSDGGALIVAQVSDPGIDRLELWADRRLLGTASRDAHGRFVLEVAEGPTGEQAIVALGFAGDALRSYRAVLVDYPGDHPAHGPSPAPRAQTGPEAPTTKSDAAG